MDSKQTSKQTADKLIQWIRQFASLHIDSHSADEQRGFPPHVLLELGNQGFFGIHISRKYAANLTQLSLTFLKVVFWL